MLLFVMLTALVVFVDCVARDGRCDVFEPQLAPHRERGKFVGADGHLQQLNKKLQRVTHSSTTGADATSCPAVIHRSTNQVREANTRNKMAQSNIAKKDRHPSVACEHPHS
jgi:hypothetical protein